MSSASYNFKPSISKYTNWIEACLAVQITKEGIEPFVYDEIKQFQQKSLADICYNNWIPSGTVCSSCCTENVVVCPTNRICNVGRGKCCYHINSAKQYLPAGCPNKICHNLKKEIQNAHRYYGPSYKNTDATQWCTNPWEVAKCFMPPDGYSDVTSSAETDFNGIISVILNYKDFQAKISDDLSKKSSIFEKGRNIDKAVRHSPRLEVEDADLQQYLTDLHDILSDLKYIADNKNAQNARKKLSQLQNDTLDIDMKTFCQMLEDVANDVRQHMKKEKDDLKMKSYERKLELINATRETIERTGKSTLSEINDVLTSALREFEAKSKKCKHQIHKKLDVGIKKMKIESDIGVQGITSITNKSVQQIEENITTINEQTGDRLELERQEYPGITGDKNIEGTKDAMTTVKTIYDRTRQFSCLDGPPGTPGSPDHISRTGEPGHNVEAENTVEKKALDKGLVMLLEYIEPDPILHFAKQCKLFSYGDCRDIEEQQTTTEKNRSILEKIRRKGEDGFTKFKDCLLKADQSLIVDLLIKIECGDETQQIEEQIKEKREATIKQRQLQEEEQYQQIKERLKEDLAEFYRDRHSTIPLSPLFEEKDTPLLDFYLMPGMNFVKMVNGKEVKTAIQSLSELYKFRDEFSKEIYVTADAGFGKTEFSKYLTVLWCQAHFPDKKHTKHLKEESVNAMREFEFIFLVLLRDSSDCCSIDDMIFNQVVRNLSHSTSYNRQFLQEILFRERCLVVLDGLDEWTHPDKKCGKVPKNIPHRNVHKNCTYMTTTRPWKLSTTRLNTKQLNKKIELTNLDSDSALELTTRTLKKLKGGTDFKMKNEAIRLLERYRDFEQVSVPLLLTYVICLWCDDIPVGQTKCGLYTSIIELLLSRTVKIYEKYSQAELPQYVSDIPQCFSEQEHCKAYFTFLTSLGELAFQTFFSETSENRLVFDSIIAEKCLKEENFLELGRLTGIITQDRQTKITSQIRKTSFSHKTVQEFFAALYISTCPDQDKVLTKVLSFCNSIQDSLYLSKVFIFISGIKSEYISLLSNELMVDINKDEITSEYRSTTEPGYKHPLIEIQNMFVLCMTEIPDNENVNICLQDYFFDDKCEHNNYYTNLQRLARQNKTYIKSINILYPEGRSLDKIIDDCELCDLENCQKIHCVCECKEGEIIPLLSNSVKYLNIESIQGNTERSSFTDKQCKAFHNSSQLETINISDSKVSQKFLNYIIDVKSLKEIKLHRLSLTEHESSSSDQDELYPRFQIDLSKHSKLRKLELWFGNFTLCDMNEDESSLIHKMRNIEYVELNRVRMSSLSLHYLVELIKNLEDSVRVDMLKCEIIPKIEYRDIRDYIHRSKLFCVKDHRDMDRFEFATMRNQQKHS